MILKQVKAGTIDVSVVIRIIDSTDGTPELGVVFNSAGIDLQYRREGAANVAITEVTLAALTTAHADGGFLHIGNGYYRLDLPDAACAAGVQGVLVHGIVTGMVVIGCYVQLTAYDPYDTVRLGLTALPNVASGSAGALLTAGTGTAQLSVTGGVGNANVTAIVDATITAAKLATDAITAAKIAADAIAEIQAGLATAAALATIQADTDNIQTRLPAALIGGRINADATAISGSNVAADAVAANIANLDATVSSRNAVAPLDAAGVRAAVGLATANLDTQIAAIWDKAMVDLTAVPGVTTTALSALNWVFVCMRNQLEVAKTGANTATATLRKDDGITAVGTAAEVDDGTTFTRGKWG
jgi:hypothetical protein